MDWDTIITLLILFVGIPVGVLAVFVAAIKICM